MFQCGVEPEAIATGFDSHSKLNLLIRSRNLPNHLSTIPKENAGLFHPGEACHHYPALVAGGVQASPNR